MHWDPLEELSPAQREKLQEYEQLLVQFNRKINLVSRQDTDAIQEDHIRHCLALTHMKFPDGATVVDWGTGGGLPSIPLAIAIPDVSFFAVDAVEKKVQAVRTFARRLRLSNLTGWHGRAEEWRGSTHYSVSRATAPLADLWRWHERVAEPLSQSEEVPHWTPGLICLKGGDLTNEIQELQGEAGEVSVSKIGLEALMNDRRFAEKYIVSVSRRK